MRVPSRANVNRTHGHAGGVNNPRTATYRVWSGILTRCLNLNNRAYANYGGRGIKVCERWLKFENFLADMGEMPTGKSLDRINNDGNYEPSNCRWATRLQQAENSRAVRLLTHNGETMHVAAWARKLGISAQLVAYRLWRGWGVGDALTLPRYSRRQK